MNKALWKMEKIGERLWNMAMMTTANAAALAGGGKGMAVVAEETRKMAVKVEYVVESAMFNGEEINKDNIKDLALQLNLLALNGAIEAYRLGYLGKQAAVFAEEIRTLAAQIIHLLNNETSEKARQYVHPWPKDAITSIGASEFIYLDIGGINILERLDNVKEVCAYIERKDSAVMLRGMELPLIDCYHVVGKIQEIPIFVILQTLWAEQNKTYAVTADVKCLHYTTIGRPIEPPSDMPLAKYVRECWESESGEMFYFMDWTKMVV